MFVQTVILLYLIDNNTDTSWMILLGSGMGVVIEAWKASHVMRGSFTHLEIYPDGLDHEGGGHQHRAFPSWIEAALYAEHSRYYLKHVFRDSASSQMDDQINMFLARMRKRRKSEFGRLW